MDCEIPDRFKGGTSGNEDIGFRRGVDCEIPHRLRNEWQRGRWVLKEMDCEIRDRFKRGTSGNEDAGPEGEWTVRFHIGWREERSIPYKGVEISP